MIIIADSSPLIALSTINSLNLLDKLFDKIYVPEAVFTEVIQDNKPYSGILLNYLYDKRKSVINKLAVELLLNDLGFGESESIILALETKSDYILIDDLKARKFANLNGLNVIGTMGILLLSKKMGYISAIKPLISQLVSNDIRISSRIIDITLKAADE
jgi:predicted nucleic acid-binding protein